MHLQRVHTPLIPLKKHPKQKKKHPATPHFLHSSKQWDLIVPQPKVIPERRQPPSPWAPAAPFQRGEGGGCAAEAPSSPPCPASHFLSQESCGPPLSRTDGENKGESNWLRVVLKPNVHQGPQRAHQSTLGPSNPPASDFTRSGWGLRIFISTSSQVRLLLLWGSHFENHWLRGSGPTPEKSQFWGNSLWHPLKYLRILAPSFARPKPRDHHITHVRLSLQGGQL